MKILILGGTKFLGRALAQAALEKGHTLTLFHRGQHDSDVFPGAEHLIGDRDSEQLNQLQGRQWDAVIDTSGYVPRVVRASAEMLSRQVKHYTFISSVSVYEHLEQLDLTEEAAVLQLEDETSEAVNKHYGGLKALCEKTVQAAMPGRSLIIRPGLIVGPFDFSDRFTYWPSRIAKGGEVLVPLPKERKLQVIDVRDLAAWIIKLVELQTVGTLHASGSDYTMEQLVEVCSELVSGAASFTWVPESFLNEHHVGEWMELPLWIKSDSSIGMFGLDNSQALAAGLKTRALMETVRDTLAWDHGRSPDTKRMAGLDPVREEELLRAYHNRK